jgi:hypothetical protein
MQQETTDISFSAFKNTFVMKVFICFTDIFIYKQTHHFTPEKENVEFYDVTKKK